jgi:DnaK suppressor protein
MKKEQITELKKKLEENKISLEESLSRFAKKDNLPEGDWDTIFPNVEGSSMEEKADEVEEYSALLPVEHALEVKLKNINEALERIAKNKYGICDSCGKEISYKKLSLIPETKNCKSCSK